MKRSPLPPRKKYPARSTKRIRSVNPEAKAKRDKRTAKDRRSPHMKEIRKQALERAGNQCEAVWRYPNGVYTLTSYPPQCPEWTYHKTAAIGIVNEYEIVFESPVLRCTATEGLELHHLRYPKVRPLAVTDVQMLCDDCHNHLEALKPHKRNRRNAA